MINSGMVMWVSVSSKPGGVGTPGLRDFALGLYSSESPAVKWDPCLSSVIKSQSRF